MLYEELDTVKLADFIKKRNVEGTTVTAYVRRHPELFEGHTKVKGKFMYIDDEAEKLLDEKYPLPKPVEVIEDKESRDKLLKAQEYIIKLQQQLNQQATQIAQAEAQKVLLEDKERQLAEIKHQSRDKDRQIEEAQGHIDEEKDRADQAEAEVERLKNRGLWARIRNI